MTELLIADDHPLFREALRGVVARLFPSAAIYEADRISNLYALVDDHPDADLLLLDLDIPGAIGFSALVHLRATYPSLPIVIVTAHEEARFIRRALEHGAMGFIPKSIDSQNLGIALQEVLDGGTWLPEVSISTPGISVDERKAAAQLRELTPQQFRVLQMVSTGQLNKQIAHELNVSEATIKAHMTAILRKLGASNRTQAVLIASRLGLSQDEPSETNIL
ncbi:response regulator transcription factor [Paenalcaligenes niemegkensis]|uniref:response regulator transcription factor n=1 Tax=Paenalcaligenes niemegkensis TaxID=2895469 RepID=UPI001EE782A9|nr:response regulator transcription factor [Paenalcaligenes niemegkensis]MCQ9616969.1 response regulator transcription factor [Paenalcaligenes niemegkensis]